MTTFDEKDEEEQNRQNVISKDIKCFVSKVYLKDWLGSLQERFK